MSDTQTQVPPPIEPPPPIAPPAAAPTPPPNPDGQARTWNMLCHLSALAGFMIPFGNLLGPLIVWQIKKNEIPSVDVHGKASLNFQITVTIAIFIGGFAAAILAVIGIGFLIFPLVMLLWLAGLILAIIAGIKANNGEDYKYPYSFDLVK